MLLVNARHVKQVPGRKTDLSDAQWLSAARTEWRLITATHNLTKLHSYTLAAATP